MTWYFKKIVCLIKMDWFTRALNLIVCFRLREDRAERYERLFKSRKRLEEDWFHALEMKKVERLRKDCVLEVQETSC